MYCKFKCKACKWWGEHTFNTADGGTETKIGCELIDYGNLEKGALQEYPIYSRDAGATMRCRGYERVGAAT